jgi:hypothetical protein
MIPHDSDDRIMGPIAAVALSWIKSLANPRAPVRLPPKGAFP